MSKVLILKAQGTTALTHTWYVDGTATDVGDVTVGITDATGAVVVAAGTATTNNANGTYTYTLADQTAVKLLTVTWTDVSSGDDQADTVEVVGGLLFTEAQARSFDSSALTNTTTYTDATIWAEHLRVADLLESWTGRSWIPRYRYAKFEGTGTRELYLNDVVWSTGGSQGQGADKDVQSVISGTINGSAITAANVQIMPYSLFRTDGHWTAPTSTTRQNVVLQYEYGRPHLEDGVDRIALLLLRDRLVASAISDRATSYTDELGTLRFETPGRFGNVSTIPEVNEWVKAHSAKVPLA